MSVEAAYRDLLFHGPLFQGIEAIEGMDGRGAVSLLRPSDPGRCIEGAGGSRWLLDPVLLDSALQVQVIWARLNWDVTLLPAEIGSHRVMLPAAQRPAPDGEPIRHELRGAARQPGAALPMRPSLPPRGRPPAGDARGVVGVGSAALNRLAGAGA